MERKGIDIGPVDILVYAQVLQGKRYIHCTYPLIITLQCELCVTLVPRLLCGAYYHIAGNFRGVQFSRKGDLQTFRGLIFTNGCFKTALSTIPG